MLCNEENLTLFTLWSLNTGMARMERIGSVTWMITALLMAIQMLHVTGFCQHNGITMEDGAVWNMDSCQVCTCQNSVSFCERQRCFDPRCDFQGGQILQIPANSCCPDCVSVDQLCKHGNNTIPEGAQWIPTKCQKCTCKKGKPYCEEERCNIDHCQSGELLRHLPHECCPKCLPLERSCIYEEKDYKHGEIWSPFSCTRYQCRDGHVLQFAVQCPATVCKKEETLLIQDGKCCPTCTLAPCISQGNIYQSGENWQQDPCSKCFCDNGQIVCHQQNCKVKTCGKGQKLVHQHSECCPTCVSTETSCTYQGKTFFNGHMWNTSTCDFCICMKGKVTCHKSICQQPQCSKNQNLVHLPGKCCPECIEVVGVCRHKNIIYNNGDSWKENKCELCSCVHGKIKCFHQECKICPEGTTPLALPGKCCPVCEKSNCASQCYDCLKNRPEYCTKCKNKDQVLEDGKCKSSCSVGHFFDISGVCKSCHPNCKECFGARNSHCLNCHSGSVLNKGYCTKECDQGFYLETYKCKECHPLCSSCEGKNQCTSCRHPGFMLQNGYCSEPVCNNTCAKCTREGLCWTCPVGTYLQNGVCLSSCWPGYFASTDRLCTACHPHCQNCKGSLPTQCTSCPVGKFLLHNSCVDECGPGYFEDQSSQSCKACHPSCHYCVEGSASDKCLSCNNGYLLLFEGVSYGQCVDTCPANYYPTVSGTCQACHKNCSSCFGFGDSECLTCTQPLMLKNGHCVKECGVDFFTPDAESCFACHPSCATCYGWGSDECITCPKDSFLQFGHCYAKCESGTYFDTGTNTCKACNSSCAECVYHPTDSSKHVCVKCRNQGEHPFQDTCVPVCHQGYALNDFGFCEKCHPSCSTCDKPSAANGCNSCPGGLVLTHNGLCDHGCFQGYYEASGVCHACDSNCLKCTAEGRCKQCRSKHVLQFGECIPSCYDQFYLDHKTRTCKECSWNCNTCYGPSAQECLSCMSGMLFENGSCVAVCNDGYYQDGNMCKACHPDCKTCSHYTMCTSCHPPYMLLGGMCVSDCGLNRFPDKRSHICKTNEIAPYLLLTGSRTLAADAHVLTPLSNLSLIASDIDTSQDYLLFVVVKAPSNGHLILHSSMGNSTVLKEGDNFTLQDFIDERVHFMYLPGNSLTSDFSLKVNDQKFDSLIESFYISVASQQSPAASQVKPFIVISDSYELVTLDYLSISDKDNIQDITIHVIEGPQHGKLIKVPQQNEIKNFTVKDLQERSIGYKSSSFENSHDIAVLRVWDGTNSVLFSFMIDIVSKGNKGPIIRVNIPATVEVGKMFQITEEILQAVDIGSHDGDIVFSLTPPFNNPRGGQLVRRIVEGIKTTRDVRVLQDSQEEQEVVSFTQEDINEGHIWYHHLDPDISSDFFKFQVSDKDIPPNVLRDQTFHLEITPAPTKPSSRDRKHFGMMVEEHYPATISVSHLSFQNLGVAPKFLLYLITKPLGIGEGKLENIEHSGKPVKAFTQADINDMKIVYLPPSQSIGREEKQVNFKFIVSDSRTNKPMYPEQTFIVTILPNIEVAPFVSSPAHEVLLTVDQGKPLPIGESLPVFDHDMPVDQLEVILTKAPNHGTLVFGIDDSKTVVEEGDSFSYTSVVSDMFYIHDDSSSLQDIAEFKIYGGGHTSLATLRISVIPLDKESPVTVDSASLTMSVTEGHSVALQRLNLAYTDRNSEDSEITFTFLNNPEYGVLEILSRSGTFMALGSGTSFTQEDINNNIIYYKAQDIAGDIPVTDALYFNVNDKVGNIQANQLFKITVMPYISFPPVVTVLKDMQVEQGGVSPLSHEILSATDPDTDIANLTVIIDVQPSFGFLENIIPVPGLEKFLGGIPVATFPLQDALQSFVRYVQDNHMAVRPKNDSFSFHLTDGSLSSPVYTINILINSGNKEPPLLRVEPIEVYPGRSAIISNSSLLVLDTDTPPQSQTLTLDEEPLHGTIRKLNSPTQPQHKGVVLSQGQTFTYQDVLQGLIIYMHDGNKDSSHDSYTITVFDGQFSDTKVAQVSIVSSDVETPYLAINKGLEVQSGGSAIITSEILQAIDVDSDDELLQFIVTKYPDFGYLSLNSGHEQIEFSDTEPLKYFTQKDINDGRVTFVHKPKDPSGILSFTFNVMDPKGNTLLAQKFVINVLEDIAPPSVTVNTGITVVEGSSHPITSAHLFATDINSNLDALLYSIIKPSTEGHVAFISKPKKQVRKFQQSDLSAGKLAYFHTSDTESKLDSFTFTVSDGKNTVTQTFYITILPIDDSLPFVVAEKLRVQEGTRKAITEFELKAVDLDTKDKSITFTVVQPPQNGLIQLLAAADEYISVTTFTMEEVSNNRVYYHQTVHNAIQDKFFFKVSDGSNPHYVIEKKEKNVTLADPSEFVIEILPVDDGTPILTTNLGIQYLVLINNEAMNVITRKELLTEDADTLPQHLLYTITKPPKYGYLQLTTAPGQSLRHFTQENIDSGELHYVLTDNNVEVTSDEFVFDIQDSKPTIVKDNIFHINWARISFSNNEYNVRESDGVVKVKVKRTGNVKQYSIVQCSTRPGTATSTSSVSSKPGSRDFIGYTGQVQFEEWEEEKFCIITINDDTVFEGPEQLTIRLSNPTYALLGSPFVASVIIDDPEDESVISFEERIIHVNESHKYASVTLVRTGDLSQLVSVVCYTNSLTAKGSSLTGLESGSDYRTRSRSDSSRVVFPARVMKGTCDVKILDDSVFEEDEEFELILSDPSSNAKLINITKALVVIDGPNDESFVFFGQNTVTFSEEAGEVEIEVLREGVDLSKPTMVWCGTRPSKPRSAEPSQDFLSTSTQITFSPGQISAMCPVIILDDVSSPQMEGNETFIVFLSSPLGSSLKSPNKTTVIISDTGSDIPVMQFEFEEMIIKETDGEVEIPIIRSGDLTKLSSVRCYTQQDTAFVDEDFLERPNDDTSRMTFLPGEKKKSCSLSIINDPIYEDHEHFLLHLGKPESEPQHTAAIGSRNAMLITLINPEDTIIVQLEKSAYSAEEPSQPDQPVMVDINILRSGDTSQISHVRVSTRDGSATSGIDYHAKSKLVTFQPGETKQLFKVEVLYNREREWHKTFTVILGPDEPINAEIGNISIATINIIDYQTSGSGVLPAPPIVVSLLHYDDVEAGVNTDPSSGYPLICVSPCDPHYPKFDTTGPLCKKSGINETALHFNWEVSVPTDGNSSRPPFETVKDVTPFTSPHHKVLESIYFRRRFLIRCVAQPQDSSGNLGIPLRSAVVRIGIDNAICQSTVTAGQLPLSLQSQSLVATLHYLNSSHVHHSNRLHIHVEIPHQDGMFPLISTFPLHNIRFLLTQPIYRQQHVCSNLFIPVESEKGTNYGFLEIVDIKDHLLQGPGFNRPYQFDPNVRQKEALIMYRHLNLKSCIWTFDAFYHMTELIDLCGGTSLTDFKGRDSGQTYVTIQLPLYVSYIYVTAPTGWTSLEHRTEMEFSFFYNTLLWRTGLETDSILRATLQVLRILIGKDGQLIIDFKTQAKFRGLFVMEHHTLPGTKSQLIPPENLVITFDLELVWGEETFDGPSQLWRATSNYNLKDYTGQYTVELIPCTVKPTQSYLIAPDLPLPCTAHLPERFNLPLAFQQTNRPVPVIYSLNTMFQLLINKNMFLSNPSGASVSLQEMDYKGTFSKGQTLYGRVLWNPDQDLESAYKLRIEKLYICTGRNGFVPTFDPTGEDYKEGPQFGCIQPNKNLKHRFLILDRLHPDAVDHTFHDIPFEARFANDDPEFSEIENIPGVDGFFMKVDALYKVDSGHQWYLQVMYTIGPAHGRYRGRRSATIELGERLPLVSPINALWSENTDTRNGTNMRALFLDASTFEAIFESNGNENKWIVPFLCVLLLFIIIIAVTVVWRYFFHKRQPEDDNKSNLKKDVQKKLWEEEPNNSFGGSVVVKNKMNYSPTVINSKSSNLNRARVRTINVTVHNNLKKQTSDTNGTEV